MNKVKFISVAAGLAVVGCLQSASAKPQSPDSLEPKTVTETVFYKDVSAYFYGQMPFLKKGVTFLDACKVLSPVEGTPSSLFVKREGAASDPKDVGAPLRTTKDFSPLVAAIKSDKEAYTYALFFSRKGYPWMEMMKFDYFQDVPFIGMEFVRVSSGTLAAYGLRPPRVTVHDGKFLAKKSFTIVRPVVPLDQPALADGRIVSGAGTIQIGEVAEATETVTEEGAYSFSLRRIPVKNVSIPNPLLELRKQRTK